MKRVLVTGGTGFVGRHVVQPFIDAGYEVHLVVRNAAATSQDVFRHHADLLDPAAVRRVLTAVRPSHLLHLAWYVEPGKFWTALENIQWIAASLEIFFQFAEAGGRRFVGSGTCAEYDWSGDGVCRESGTPLNPATLYGASKDATRQMLQSASNRLGISFAWGRIFHLYGPSEPTGRLVSTLASALVKGRAAACTAGTQTRDFLHVADVARAFAFLLDTDIEGAVNIGSGSPVAIAEVARIIATCAGRPDLLQLGALPSRPDEPQRLLADVRRLHEAGFRPKWSLRDGLCETVEWWRNSGADH